MTQGILFTGAPSGRLQKKRPTAGQALEFLRKYRADKIANARFVAAKMAVLNGVVTVADLREAIPGLKATGGSQVWLGAVFASPEFEWTGRWVMAGSAARNIHPKPIKVWRMRAPHTANREGSSCASLQ
jgi:hypothetical protein